MKDFFKTALATMVGLIAFNIIGMIFFFIFIGIISAMSSGKEMIKEKSVLHITLDYPVPERTSNNPLENMDFSNLRPQPGLNHMIKNIQKASRDDKIIGIYLELGFTPNGKEVIDEIRDALLEFKESGKFIYSYGETYSQNSYYLATVADSIILNPEGGLPLRGYSANALFFKKTLDKLGIEPLVFREGKYKSAVEIFQREKLSEENRYQIKEFVDDLWHHTSMAITGSRMISSEDFNQIVDSLKINLPANALEYKLVDALLYDDQVMDILREKSTLGEKEKVRLVKMSKYNNVPDHGMDRKTKKQKKKQKIAVIYANGDIVTGKGEDGQIGSTTMIKAIRKARQDEKVKAIVLRVNSGGGSSLASDIIWRELSLARQQKPLVVSMGSMAASGGYYIACMADTIIANENTLTGSIGVWGIMFNASEFLDNKLGITTDVVKTHEFADFFSPTREMTAYEQEVISERLDSVYSLFVQRVAEGRNMTREDVMEIAQGRIWSGTDALEIGLVDLLGNLDDAVGIAAGMAGLDIYQVSEYPKPENPFEQFFGDMPEEIRSSMVEKELGEFAGYYRRLESVLHQQGIMMKLPVELEIR